jgi:hypothetical protein
MSHYGAQHSAEQRTECHTNATFVRALSYSVCLDAEKLKAYRFLGERQLITTTTWAHDARG